MGYWRETIRRRRGFDGGLYLPDCKFATARSPIQDLSVHGPLHVPLQAVRGHPADPLVRIGQHVNQGDRLARPTSPDVVPVHAPIGGRVVAFERVRTVLDGFLPGVKLEPDDRDDAARPVQAWSADSFIAQIAEAGVMCAAPRAPAHRVIQSAVAAGVSDLIINAMETEPYLTADLRTLVESPGRMVDACCEIADAVGAARVWFATPRRHRRVLRWLRAEAWGRDLDVVPLPDKYPQCHPHVLVSTILDREVPVGGTPLDVAALVLPLSTVRGIADAVFNGRPVTHAVMSVAGDFVERPGTYRVPIGMSIAALIDHVGVFESVGHAVWGGPLTGVAVARDDAVVTADAVALLLFAEAPAAEPVPCIHCGWCVEDCPVGLDPTALVQLETDANVSPVDHAHLRACVDCQLCSYVCPARLPLADTIARTRRMHAAVYPDPASRVPLS